MLDYELFDNGQAGVCPKCGGNNLEYGAFELDDCGGFYPFSCNDCGAYGKECYDFTFAEHVVYGNENED